MYRSRNIHGLRHHFPPATGSQNLTQADIAAFTGIARPNIAAYEAGRSPPRTTCGGVVLNGPSTWPIAGSANGPSNCFCGSVGPTGAAGQQEPPRARIGGNESLQRPQEVTAGKLPLVDQNRRCKLAQGLGRHGAQPVQVLGQPKHGTSKPKGSGCLADSTGSVDDEDRATLARLCQSLIDVPRQVLGPGKKTGSTGTAIAGC